MSALQLELEESEDGIDSDEGVVGGLGLGGDPPSNDDVDEVLDGEWGEGIATGRVGREGEGGGLLLPVGLRLSASTKFSTSIPAPPPSTSETSCK